MSQSAQPDTLTVQEDGQALVIRRRAARRMGILYLALTIFIALLVPQAEWNAPLTPDRALLLTVIVVLAMLWFGLRGLHNLFNHTVYRLEDRELTITQEPLRFSRERHTLSDSPALEVGVQRRGGYLDPTVYYAVWHHTATGERRWLITWLKEAEAHFICDTLTNRLERNKARRSG
jgi:hypothetical protein